MSTKAEVSPRLFLETKSMRGDYNSQFEILVSLLYHLICKSGDFVIDGGANAGLHALPLAKLVDVSGHLYCFEPNPTVAFGLTRNLLAKDLLNNCSIHAQALSDHEGIVEFFIDEERPALSHIGFKPDEKLKKIVVRCGQIDKIVYSNHINFIKLDLEGADFLAIRGAHNTIKAGKPPIIFENSRAWAAKCYGYSLQDFFGFFGEIGYDIFDLHGRHLVPELWDDHNFAFEFIALDRGDTRTAQLLHAIECFWGTLEKRPALQKWDQCISACLDPVGYLKGCGIELVQ